MGNTLECCTQAINVDANDLSSDEDDETHKQLLHNPITKGGVDGENEFSMDGNKQNKHKNHKHLKHKDRAIKRLKKKRNTEKKRRVRIRSKNESQTQLSIVWVDEELYKSDMEIDSDHSDNMKMLSPSTNDNANSSESVSSSSSSDSSSTEGSDSDSDTDSDTDTDTDSSGSTSASDSNSDSEANREEHKEEPQTEISENVDSNMNNGGHVNVAMNSAEMDVLDQQMMAILTKEDIPDDLNNIPPGSPEMSQNHHSRESHHKMLSLIKGISTDILEQARNLEQKEEEINPVLPLPPKESSMKMKKSRSREKKKSKQEQYEALRKELDEAEIRLKQSKHEKKILQKENSALRQENEVLKTSTSSPDKQLAGPHMGGRQSLSPDLAPLSPITIKITTTTKTMTYIPGRQTSVDSLNNFELNPGSNQMYSIAENPHEYTHEHGFGTNTSNTSNTNTSPGTEPAFME